MSTEPIKNVAIVGATGRIGGAFAKALAETGKHNVTALVREDSKGTLPEGVDVIRVNYDDEVSIVNALKGQQFLAITLGVQAPSDLHAKIAAAAGKAGVTYVMPNTFGYPVDSASATGPYDKLVVDRIGDANNGVSLAVPFCCGFWYEWSLATGEQWFGFTIKDRKVTFFDDGKRTVTVSTWDQCGRAFAALFSLPESGSSPSLTDFKKGVHIYSFQVSQRDMLDSLNRVLGTVDSDWEIRYEPISKRIKDGAEELANGVFTGFAKMLYGNVFRADNDKSDYASTLMVANEALALPKEDLDEATKRTVDMVEGGWSPFENMA
ncbi:uncharacterized protein N7503_006066 [Penicillium pulvis]|uniref:uncharacterized protein n=1 Tax=Penicillium pulvis TaxID=1562058 RepID=UPI00254886EC|nr:uncharacterized protein N7503_006066 [Penicillium pulvis]KAJ5803616.1 hypothetical protein N7503_006066 [Penicillium pulvis]